MNGIRNRVVLSVGLVCIGNVSAADAENRKVATCIPSTPPKQPSNLFEGLQEEKYETGILQMLRRIELPASASEYALESHLGVQFYMHGEAMDAFKPLDHDVKLKHLATMVRVLKTHPVNRDVDRRLHAIINATEMSDEERQAILHS